MATSLTQLQVATSLKKQKLKVATINDRELHEHDFHLQSDLFPHYQTPASDDFEIPSIREIAIDLLRTLFSSSNEFRNINWIQNWQPGESTSVKQKLFESTIRNLFETAGDNNWDGEDADPVTQSAVDAALKVAAMLPDSVETPEIAADPHGNVEFDWNLENGTMFTISVGHSGKIAISGLNPKKARLRGLEENSEGDSVYLLLCGLNWLVEMNGK